MSVVMLASSDVMGCGHASLDGRVLFNICMAVVHSRYSCLMFLL